MFKLIKELFRLLTLRQRRKFYVLQILVILSAFAEILGVISIIPFMMLVGDMSILQRDTFINKIYQTSGLSSEIYFVFLIGIGVLLILFVSSLISMFTTWKTSIFATGIGAEISTRLYKHYLRQNWLYHTLGSSAELTKNIATDSARVSSGILLPLMRMNARILFSLLMITSIFIYDPVVGLIGAVIFTIAYLILFKVVKDRLQVNGEILTQETTKRYVLIKEGFGGIKDILLLGRDNDFVKRFQSKSQEIAYSLGVNQALSLVPRYFIELIAFTSLITLTLYLLVTHDGNLGTVLPVISVYALATFRLLPAFQQIYVSLAAIKGHVASFESIKQDLIDSSESGTTTTKLFDTNLSPKEKISLENVTFTYPNKTTPTLEKINMTIATDSVVGIVGASGSGKSTLINVLLGLIEPQGGSLTIDNIVINNQNRRSWQNNIGFVAQNIFLSEGTIAENVAFGIAHDEIKFEQVQQALDLAHLTDLLENLDHGIHTKVGEGGVQLSGGQRQRIGIARALYHEADVLVFDEATSSLDGITEKAIIDAIHQFSGKKTIIMIAHRLKTVKKCDLIFFVDNGKVVDKGSYQELLMKNPNFNKLATHS